MFIVSFITGLLVGSISIYALIQGARPNPRLSWSNLESIDRALSTFGFGGGFVTRGFYVNAVALLVMSLAMICGAFAMEFDIIALLHASVSLLFLMGLTFGVSMLVVRFGKPRSWIPEKYRNDSFGEK